MSFQRHLMHFYEVIHLNRFDENAELRQKRDRILERLRANLSTPFDWFNQGSYAMGTGVKPTDGDYDIDIGIVLDVDHQTHDPVTVNGWIHKAVDGHTASVEWRRPCITVNYQQSGEPIYHVDLAILAKDRHSGQLRLALGKENSAADQRAWQLDDRKGFISAVASRFSGEDAAQFRRVICYLKRWKGEHFASEGRAAPSGLSLTVAAHSWFQPATTGPYHQRTYDDLGATESLARAIHRSFAQTWDHGQNRWVPRLSLKFPNAPYDDVAERMTNQQMLELHQRLEKLIACLEEARVKNDVAPLRRAFGKDFPEK